MIGGSIIRYSICDRIFYNPHRIKLKVKSLRKKMLLESLIQGAYINKAKNVKLTLQIPLEKFRVFIPNISPKRRKTQNGFCDSCRV